MGRGPWTVDRGAVTVTVFRGRGRGRGPGACSSTGGPARRPRLSASAGTYLSRVSVPLARLERVWVFVGGAGGWTGAYTLNVRFRGP